ncbi:MAG: hypothetical protein RLZZ242_973 [Bacteroidota bacterium]
MLNFTTQRVTVTALAANGSWGSGLRACGA